MIIYKFEEELQYVKLYVNKLEDSTTLRILEESEVRNSFEAVALSEFFLRMVDLSIEDEKKNVELPWKENAEFWNEKLMNSFSGYLEKIGYENEWDEVFDKQ